MSETTTKCRYCRDGNVPDENGDHWIVKSIIPAKINIRKCADFKARDELAKARGEQP